MTECYCDYEPAAFYLVERRKSRKQRKCYECGGLIKCGDQYEHVYGKWEDVNSFDTCCLCLALRDYVEAHVPCTCWQHGNTIEDCMETAKEYAHEAPGLLFGAYRREIAINRSRRNDQPH